MNTMNKYAPTFLRLGIAAVVVWFGIAQLAHASDWFGFLPDWTSSLPISQTLLVHLDGWFEIVFGASLFFGFYTRLTSALLALHLLEITYAVGYGAIGARDLGLTFALISVFLEGPSPLSLDFALTSEE